jgi:hypothetical protein
MQGGWSAPGDGKTNWFRSIASNSRSNGILSPPTSLVADLSELSE